jgi:hypothetical protein
MGCMHKISKRFISPTKKLFEKEFIKKTNELENEEALYIGNTYVSKSYVKTIAPVIIVVIILCAIYLIFFA